MGSAYLVLIGALAVAGSQAASPDRSQSPGSNNGPVNPVKGPYTRIFQAPASDPSSKTPVFPAPQTLHTKRELQPRVVCGMVVFPVKPDADSRMVVRPKPDRPTDYKMRGIAPQVCNE